MKRHVSSYPPMTTTTTQQQPERSPSRPLSGIDMLAEVASHETKEGPLGAPVIAAHHRARGEHVYHQHGGRVMHHPYGGLTSIGQHHGGLLTGYGGSPTVGGWEGASHPSPPGGGGGGVGKQHGGPPVIRGPRYVCIWWWGWVPLRSPGGGVKRVLHGVCCVSSVLLLLCTFCCICTYTHSHTLSLIIILHPTPITSSPAHHIFTRPSHLHLAHHPHRGWTAFTAFGMAHREQVRREHPGASATQVEKVG